MNERRRLKRVPHTFSPQTLPCQSAQFIINERKQTLRATGCGPA